MRYTSFPTFSELLVSQNLDFATESNLEFLQDEFIGAAEVM